MSAPGILNCRFVIDGLPQEFTPVEILNGVTEPSEVRLPEKGEEIVDESLDPSPLVFQPVAERLDEYLSRIDCAERVFPVPFASGYTRLCLAQALIDSIWRQGRFTLEDITVTAKWTWSNSRIGDMAALYRSVEAAADTVDRLGLQLRRYSCADGRKEVRFSTPFSGAARICPETLQPDPESWIVYVPFDTSEYRLGGSLLSQVLETGGGVEFLELDPDYFMDCYEVVREFVEDGILLSATTVGEGGIAAALKRMISKGVGAAVELSGVLKSSGESDPVRILFSEIPGVLLQISGVDFDYLDAQFILQDVAYFPLGHPTPDSNTLNINASAKTGLQNILESLMLKYT